MKSLPKLIVIVGPTAVGKTTLSIDIARFVNGEVISADSRQVYRGLNLGTGKVTPEETLGIPHHLLDVATTDELFTAHQFVELGERALKDILSRNKVPIVVGGTGFYIDALLHRIELAHAPRDLALRARLETQSLSALNDELLKLDPERSKTIDKHNRVRVIRAIEIALSESPESNTHAQSTTPIYDVLWIGLAIDREDLKNRISARLKARFEAGMLDEARSLHAKGLAYERMEELGLEYRYMARHLQGSLTYDEMIVELEHKIYQYAKRQMTWFKKNKNIVWYSPDQVEDIRTACKKFLG